MKNLFKGNSALVINNLFQILLVTYLVLILVEELWTGSVSNYLNLNYFLIVVITFGILDVLSEKLPKENKPVRKLDYFFILFLSILGAFIIKYKTIQLGWLSWTISIIAGVLILLLSILILEDKEDDEAS